MTSRTVSLAKAAEEVGEKLKYEKEVLTEDKFTFNHYKYTQTKLAKIQRRENVFVFDTELCAAEGNGDGISYSVGYYTVSKLSRFMVHRYPKWNWKEDKRNFHWRRQRLFW